MNELDAVRLNFSPESLIALDVILAFVLFGVALDMRVADFKGGVEEVSLEEARALRQREADIRRRGLGVGREAGEQCQCGRLEESG